MAFLRWWLNGKSIQIPAREQYDRHIGPDRSSDGSWRSRHVDLDAGVFEAVAKWAGVEARLALFAQTQMAAGQEKDRDVVCPARSARPLLTELAILLKRPGVHVVHVPMMGGCRIVRLTIATALLALLSAGRLLRLVQVRPQRTHQGLAVLHLRLPVVSLHGELLHMLGKFLVAEPHLLNLYVLLPKPARYAFLNCPE